MELKAMVISTVITIIIWFPFMIRQVKRGGYKHKGDIIVEEAEKAGLTAIALTDHNTCKNCPAFFAAAAIPFSLSDLT